MLNTTKADGMSAIIDNSSQKLSGAKNSKIHAVKPGASYKKPKSSKQLARHISELRDLLTSKGWKANKSNLNMSAKSSFIEFDELDSPNGPIFDINLYTRVADEGNKYLGTVIGCDSHGEAFPATELADRVQSSFLEQ